ncbi:MAG: cell surface protein SprA, partial [Ignavibacteriales bacterium]|nr:cell surface protein SprA [Ignavibacteriales bacterium]
MAAVLLTGSYPSPSQHRSLGLALSSTDSEVPQDTTRRGARIIVSGGKTRRARAAEIRPRVLQSLQSLIDTTRRAEFRITSLPRDSSARLAQQMHLRKDPIVVSDVNRSQHPMYLNEPAAIVYRDELDSTNWKYRRRRLLGSLDTRIPFDVPFDEYVKLRLDQAIQSNFESITKLYLGGKEKKEGLGELFGKVTNIEIPVPKNPIFSIFGPNIIKVQINGSVDIHAAFRNTKSDLYNASPLGQSRNEPDFNQQVQVGVKGEIGDKLKIDADWNTQRTFEYENQLRVHYTGYEDEIVQSVEAGNVSLATSSSFIAPSSALFGIKAAFQFGPLRLTTVASQKKGQIKELSVSGGASSVEFRKRMEEYSTDHYFLDSLYIGEYERVFYTIPPNSNPNLEVRDLEVWTTRNGTPDPKDRNIIAFMSIEQVVQFQGNPALQSQSQFQYQPDSIEVGRWLKLEPATDYTFNAKAGILTLNRSLQFDQAVAVAFVVSNADGSPLQIGDFGSRTSSSDTTRLVMKLVRPKYLGPNFKKGWRLMLKNRYQVAGRGMKKDGFDLHIDYEVAGQPPQRNLLNNIGTLEMFGWDRYSGDANIAGQDQKFDYIPGYTVDESRGEVIFPTLEPFRPQNIAKMLGAKLGAQAAQAAADSFGLARLYDTTKTGAMNDDKNKFFITGSASSSIRSTYPLGSFNIVDGSVQVIVDGQTAVPNVDYTVDYIAGQVVIKNQSFLVPGRNLQIKYEANDLFQLASKTLLAARGDLDVGKNSSLGFTIMNLNQKSLSDKVRLGEEPISNTIMGMDGGTTVDLPFLTKALNFLPGVRSMAMSQISFRGEAAYMSPDPNTRKSAIPADHGSGLAYIDDFEGARKTIPLGTAYSGWKDASPPFYIPGIDVVQPDAKKNIATSNPLIVSDQDKVEYKAKMTWFNVIPSDVFIRDIWPNRSYAAGQDQVSALNFYFRPGQRGTYNYSMDLENKIFAPAAKPKQWAGVQHLLGLSSSNLLDDNMAFIELWVNVVQTAPGAKLMINLGYVNEDVIPNRKLDTEDGLDNPSRTPNGILNPDIEDVGIDGLRDAEERVAHQDFLVKYPQFNDDPSGDNWRRPPQGASPSWGGVFSKETAEEYDGANGTEGNSKSEVGIRPDAEDLNGNNNLDRANSYFEYEIPLDTTSVVFQKMIVGGGVSGWYQLRIPLDGYARTIGEPTLSNVEGVRFWFTGSAGDVFIRTTEMNLVGNQWEKINKQDTSFNITVVNIEENQGYTSPVKDVLRTRDPTQPDKNILSNEQSLNLIVHGLASGQKKEAFKRFSIKPLDVFSYRTMKMFVHGEMGDVIKGYRRFDFVDLNNYDAEIYLRFGTDSLNYYEYRAPVHPDWDPQNEIIINFADLTAIKLARDSAGALTKPYPVPQGPQGSTYRVKGEPSLLTIRYISIGIENPGKGAAVLDGEIWADELRLIDVDNTPGWAYRLDTGVKLADIGSIAFSFSDRDPFFHGLEERFGSRNTNRSWILSANFSFERLLPESWNGTLLGFSYSHVEAITRPRYIPGTDVLVANAADRVGVDKGQDAANQVRLRTEALMVTETYALPSIRFNFPVDSWLITETINRMSFGYNYTYNTSRSPVTEFAKSWSWSFHFGYALPFGQNNFIAPFSWAENLFILSWWRNLRIYYAPKQVTVGFNLSRGQAKEKTRSQLTENPTQRNFGGSRSMSFSWQFVEGGFLNLGVDYQVDVASNLVHFELDRLGRQRSLSDILSDLVLSDRLINFGIDHTYGQTIALNNKLTVPSVLMLDRIITPRLTYSTRYDWQNNVQAGELGKNAGWSNTIGSSLDFNIRTISDLIFG